MKKTVTILLALALVLSLAIPAFAAESDSRDVTAKYEKTEIGGDDIRSFELSWGDLTFTYAETVEKTWNVKTHDYDEEVTGYADETQLVSKVYKGANGYALEVLPSGFDNTITMMVGVDLEGKVLGISIVSHTETAGLGAVAADATPKGVAFRNQFVGMSGSVSVTKDGGEVNAITGATITSRAICVGVNAALKAVAGLG